jgi:parallel beta-helix repeat protein
MTLALTWGSLPGIAVEMQGFPRSKLDPARLRILLRPGSEARRGGVVSKKLVRLVLLSVVGMVLLATTAPAASAKAWIVDDDVEQCANADSSSIQDAVNRAAPGDLIKVCPGTYRESVLVNKSNLELTAPGGGSADCFEPSSPDPQHDAIVQGQAFGFRLERDDIKLAGFVVGGATIGIWTSGAASGYEVSHNVVERNARNGMDLASSGALESRIGHNCVRNNLVQGIDDFFGSGLRNASVTHNDLFSNTFDQIVLTRNPQQVEIAHNRALNGVHGYSIFNSSDSSLHHNETSGNQTALQLQGNTGLAVEHNELVDGSEGIHLLDFQPVNRDLVVSHNVVAGHFLDGILVGSAQCVGCRFSHNRLNDNGRDGLNMRAGNSGNRVEHNEADRNGSDGIHVQGAIGNVFVRNSMFDNGEHDAHDDARPTNEWIRNSCDTDFPAGTICN